MWDYIRRRLHAVRYAVEGIQFVLSHHPHFLIHMVLSSFIIILLLTLKVYWLEITMYVLAALIGFVTELINTSIELITDIAATGWRKEAKIAKDVGAGAVLLAVGVELVVATILIAPYL